MRELLEAFLKIRTVKNVYEVVLCKDSLTTQYLQITFLEEDGPSVAILSSGLVESTRGRYWVNHQDGIESFLEQVEKMNNEIIRDEAHKRISSCKTDRFN